MNLSSADNYPQNYFEEEYYEPDQLENFQGTCGDVSNLQVPNARLFPEGYESTSNVYHKQSEHYAPVNAVEHQRCSYGHTTRPPPVEYCYITYPKSRNSQPYPSNAAQQATLSRDRQSASKSKSTFSKQKHPNVQYSTYADSVQDACIMHENVPKVDPYDVQTSYEDNYYYEQYQDNIHTFRMHQNKCVLHQNSAPYDGGYEVCETPDEFDTTEYKEKQNAGTGSKATRNSRKYPVTVKTPKYVTKNVMPANVNKRTSVLCLPVVTQPDPALVRKKSKTGQVSKRNPSHVNRQCSTHIYDQENSYSAHIMNSEGDVKTCLSSEGLDKFLDDYESHVVLNDRNNMHEVYEGEEVNFKEFTKFMKPRVPSSVKLRQERLASLKSKSLQPQMKLSLDKLLHRLQKCENVENLEHQSDEECSPKTCPSQKCERAENNDENINKVNSFTYDSLTRNHSVRSQSADRKEEQMQPNSGSRRNDKESVNVLLGSLEKKRSTKIVKSMDDHCALDLHRSKSYIVDLIDRALSKELGTVPRDQLLFHDLTPHKAVAAISRHQQSNQKELCYEVTAALTDSIISSASAPPKDGFRSAPEPSTSQNAVQKPSEEGYIKQLKQLRWGHIRHIQHEARKLADLEEFLEKCGEIDY